MSKNGAEDKPKRWLWYKRNPLWESEFEYFDYTLEVHIWTRPRCQGGCEVLNTVRDRCRPIAGLVVQTSYGLRALRHSALPRLSTPAAARALSRSRGAGSRSALACQHRAPTSHRAARLLQVLPKPKSHEQLEPCLLGGLELS